MSILQEYEEINEMIGNGRVSAIEDYIKYCKDEKNKDILYSDIVYKEKEYKLFDKWFNKRYTGLFCAVFDNKRWSRIRYNGSRFLYVSSGIPSR